MGLEEVFQDLSSMITPLLEALGGSPHLDTSQLEAFSDARNFMAIGALVAAGRWFALPLFRFSLILVDLLFTVMLYMFSAPAMLLAALTASSRDSYDTAAEQCRARRQGFEDTFSYQEKASARAAEKQKIAESIDAFEVLGVPENAEDEEIRKAYRKLMKMYHPDYFMTAKPADQQRARKMTLKIRAAYDTLTENNSQQTVH
jgi:hypothetical protein